MFVPVEQRRSLLRIISDFVDLGDYTLENGPGHTGLSLGLSHLWRFKSAKSNVILFPPGLPEQLRILIDLELIGPGKMATAQNTLL